MISSQQSSGDYWDDDWDDDSEVGQTQAYIPQQQQQQHMLQLSQHHSVDYGDLVSIQTIHSVIPERPIPNIPKKNNKFSTLIKSGEDSFLLGMKVANVPESEKIYIDENENGRHRWVSRGELYSCVVTSPKKESKLKGLKSFIVYQLTPTVYNFVFYIILIEEYTNNINYIPHYSLTIFKFQEDINILIGYMNVWKKNIALFLFHHYQINKYLEDMKNNLLNIDAHNCRNLLIMFVDILCWRVVASGNIL